MAKTAEKAITNKKSAEKDEKPKKAGAVKGNSSAKSGKTEKETAKKADKAEPKKAAKTDGAVLKAKVTAENESLTIASEHQQPVPDDISDATASLVQHLEPPTTSDPMQPNPVHVTKETPRYSDADLAEFQKVIDAAREEAMDELRMLRERLDDLNNSDFAEESAVYSMHMAEQGNEAQEKEKTYAQIQRINDYVRKLEEATARIQDKTYGVCRECNILIAKQRLLAVPITTLSASWKIRQQCPADGIDRVGKQA